MSGGFDNKLLKEILDEYNELGENLSTEKKMAYLKIINHVASLESNLLRLMVNVSENMGPEFAGQLKEGMDIDLRIDVNRSDISSTVISGPKGYHYNLVNNVRL